jgi:hypothetical protein
MFNSKDTNDGQSVEPATKSAAGGQFPARQAHQFRRFSALD